METINQINRVVLLNVSGNLNQVQLPIGLGILINSLKLNNIPVSLIDFLPVPVNKREEYFLSRISPEPCIYGFTIIGGNNNLKEVEKYAQRLLQINPKSIIVYGGPLPSSAPETLLRKCSCQYIVRGEGEVSFPKLVKSIFEGNYYPEDISGVYYLKEGNFIGKKNEMIRKLDQYSKVDYSLFDMEFYIAYLNETGQSFEIMASKGCPYNCYFCFKSGGTGMSTKTASAVLDEIEHIRKTYNMNRFYFVDENFFAAKSFFKDFIEEKQKRGLEFTFIIQARIDSFDREMLQLAKDHGLVGMSTAIEAVSQEELDRIKKNIQFSHIESQLNLMKEVGVQVWADFIIGFPGDTIEGYKQIIKFVRKHKLEKRFKLSYLTPLPGTQLWEEAVQKGLIKDEFEYIHSMGDLFFERMANLTRFTDEVLDHYYNEIASIGRRPVDYPKHQRYLSQIREIH